MQGIILAAGKGTRLAPLTYTLPKALVSLGNRTLLDHILEKILQAGIKPIVINLHTFGTMIKQHVLYHYGDNEIYFSEETFDILGTGGGIVQAATFLSPNEPVLVHNVDVLTTLDLKELHQAFEKMQSDVMLVVKRRHSSRELFFDAITMEWIGWRQHDKIFWLKSSSKPLNFGFCGISVFSTQLLQQIDRHGNFSFIELLQLLQPHARIVAYPVENEWLDAGKLENIIYAKRFLKK